MAAPRRLDQDHRLLETIAHQGAEFELDAGPARRTVADGQGAVPVEKLDEHVVTHDPLVVFAEVGEKFLRLGVDGLALEQRVGGLPLHVRLAGEDENLDRLFVGTQGGGGNNADDRGQKRRESHEMPFVRKIRRVCSF